MDMKIIPAQTPHCNIGLFGIGLDTYWDQFDGLLTRLNGYQDFVATKLHGNNCTIINGGIVDNPFCAKEVAQQFQNEKVDVVFLFITTYALSHNVLPVVQSVKAPIIVLNLQPEKAINYDAFNAIGDRGKMTGEWLGLLPKLCSARNSECI